jgi:flagellin-like protein
MLKGISPLVAVIMLIAFTLVIGGILAAWVSQFTIGQRTMVQRCTGAMVILQRGSYDSGAKNLTLVINNYGNVDLAFVPIILQSGATTKLADKIYVAAGSIVTYNLTGIESTLEQVTIQSMDCDPPCYKCLGAQDLLLNTDIRGLR